MKLRQHIYTSARLLGAALFSLSLPTALSSCDTTEEGYHVGTLSDVYLTTEPATQLRVPADGQPRDIAVSSNVDWEIEDLEGVFAATASDRHGDGTITVTAGLNVNSEQVRTASLRIYARDFNKAITVELIQARMNFNMAAQDYDPAPEQGMTYHLLFNSSIDWTFTATEGELAWLDFKPGPAGGGDWNEFDIAATFLPNYTTDPRAVTLQLRPSDASLLEYVTLPPRFTLTQAAGTLPSAVSAKANGDPTYTSIPVTVSYASAAPVDEVGVIIASTGQRFVAPLQAGASYPQSGSVNFSVDGLAQKTLYNFTPFVRSKVGESTGVEVQFSTDGDIDFDGPELTGYHVDPSTTSVTASFTIQSDVQIQTVTVQLRDAADALIAEQRESVNALSTDIEWNQLVTLQPNTDYRFTLAAEIINPNNHNVETYNLPTLPFRTTLRTPQEGDNQPIK